MSTLIIYIFIIYTFLSHILLGSNKMSTFTILIPYWAKSKLIPEPGAIFPIVFKVT